MPRTSADRPADRLLGPAGRRARTCARHGALTAAVLVALTTVLVALTAGPPAHALAPTAAPTTGPVVETVVVHGDRVHGTLTVPRAQAPTAVRDATGRHRVTVTAPAPVPVELVLAVDVSGSMAGAPLDAARAATRATLGALRTWSTATGVPVTVTVLRFAARPRLDAGPAPVADARLDAALTTVTPAGETALDDALGLAADTLAARPQPARGLVAVLSDGADTASSLAEPDALALLAGIPATLITVPVPGPEADPVALAGLAERAHATPTTLAELPTAVLAAADLPVAQRFSYHGGVPDARWRLELADGTRLPAPTHRERTPAATPGPTTPGQPVPVLALGAVFAGLSLAGILLVRRRPTLDAAARLGTYTAPDPSPRPGPVPGPGTTRRVPLGLLATMVAAALGGLALAGPLGLAAGPGLVALARTARRRLAVAKRRRAFDAQLPDALVMLAGALRAGHGLTAALEHTAAELVAPAGPALQAASAGVALGTPIADALEHTATEEGSADLAWIAQAVAVQAELGGSLADLVDRVAATIRERQRLRRRVSALSAEGRLSAVVLFVLPIGLAGVMRLLNPAYLATLTGSPLGWLLCAVGATLMVAGGFWMKALVKVEF